MAFLPLLQVTSDSARDAPGFAELLQQLGEGWQIEPPVYVMSNPIHPGQTVFRLVLWRHGRPKVASVPDGPEIRQFIAQRQLRKESL